MSRAGLIAWPFLNDAGLYAVLGRTVATGGVPYRDFYETKLPGAGLLAAGFWRAFGPHWAGYVLCQLAMALLASVAMARAARRHIGNAAMLPTLLFAVVFLNFDYAVYTGFQLETIQAFFEALAASAALECLGNDDPFAAFAAGLAAGCAAMAKPGGAGVAIVLMICLLRRRPLWILLVLGGFAGPTLATIYYTVRSGAWPYLPQVIRDVERYASGTPMHLDALLKIAVLLLLFGWPFIVRVIGQTSLRRSATSLVLLFALLWFAIDLLAAIAQRRLYPYHFLPLACPAALLYGLLPASRSGRIALGLLPIAMLSLTWEGSSLAHLGRGFQHTPVSNYIAVHTSATDSVFADQAGRLLIETDRSPGSRLGTFFYFVNDDSAPRDYCSVMLADFEARRPRYLVLNPGWDQPVPALADCDILSHAPARRANFIAAWSLFRSYVHAHYQRETILDGQELYRRMETAPAIKPKPRAS